MTISAQVIDTIVEWIDDNLHQPLRIDDIARHAGYSNGIYYNGCFTVQRRARGAIFARKLLAARDLRDTDQRVYDILPQVWHSSRQTFTRVCGPFNQPPGAYRQREPQSRPH